jgi:hypothetical protein
MTRLKLRQIILGRVDQEVIPFDYIEPCSFMHHISLIWMVYILVPTSQSLSVGATESIG